MINPNGDDFTKNDPLPGSVKPSGEPMSSGSPAVFRTLPRGLRPSRATPGGRRKQMATTARERTEFFLRENPVPTVIGALAVGLAIGLAIRYSSESARREVEVKSLLGNVDLSILSLPFLWPFFKSVRNRYEDSADVVKEGVREGVGRLKKVEVDHYVKPLRKKWRSWTN